MIYAWTCGKLAVRHTWEGGEVNAQRQVHTVHTPEALKLFRQTTESRYSDCVRGKVRVIPHPNDKDTYEQLETTEAGVHEGGRTRQVNTK